MKRFFLTSLAIASLAACEGSARKDAGPVWQLDSVITLTGPSRLDPFKGVRSLAWHTDGRLVVIDSGAKRVSVFTPERGPGGAPAGNPGNLPGDYTEPYSAAWLSDTLAIYDPERSRVMFLAGAVDMIGEQFALKLVGSSAIRFYPVSPRKAFLRSVQADGTRLRSIFLGFTGHTSTDTIVVPDAPPVSVGAQCRARDGTTTYFVWPEAPMVLVTPIRDDGTTAYALSSETHLTLRSARGDSTGVIETGVPRVPLSTAEWNAGVDAYNKFIVRNGAESCDAKPARPDFKAAIRAVTVSTDGDLWVTTATRNGFALDVFGRDNVHRGTIEVPDYQVLIAISVSGDRLALVQRGDKNANVVKVFRIIRK